MDIRLIWIGFLIGMLIGILIMMWIDHSHQKKIQKIDDDFKEWKRIRSNKFIAELDEMNSKSHEYWRDEAMKDLRKRECVTNPDAIDPTTHIKFRR